MKIRFLPRGVASAWKPGANSAIISVYDKEDGINPLQDGWSDVLRLNFSDIDAPAQGLILFDETHAKSVLQFAESNRMRDELVVHCKAGESRSGAIAIFLAEMYGAQCFKEHSPKNALTWTKYNRWVYAQLRDAVYGKIGSAFEAMPLTDAAED